MANEFLPSSTLGQLRRGVKGLDGKRAPEVSREEGRRHEKVRQQKGLYRVARHSTLVPAKLRIQIRRLAAQKWWWEGRSETRVCDAGRNGSEENGRRAVFSYPLPPFALTKRGS